MLDSTTRRKIDNARDILVGIVPDPKSQIDLITITLIYKFMDDMDSQAEELGGRASFFVGDFAKYRWSKVMDQSLSGHERLQLFDEGLLKMNQNPHLPELFRYIFKNAFLPFRNMETLNMFLEELNGFEYSHSEKLGDAFEYLLSIMSSQGNAGQFRTPRHIIEFIVDVVNPTKEDTILDPACGTAGFLISAYKHIMEKNTQESYGDQLTSEEREKIVTSIVGYEISPDMVRLSLVNMFLHKFPNPQIFEYDTLTSQARWDDNFSCILANPPFMSPKGGIKPHERYAIKSKRSEVLFVDYMMEHLTEDGKAGIIVPEGIIFQSQKAHTELRKKMVEDNYLWAVVSLPSGIFQPYSGVKTSVLLFDKVKAKYTDKIIFAKVENDGYSLGAQRQPIAKNDLPGVLAGLRHKFLQLDTAEEQQFENITVVKKSTLAENEYNLSAGRYFEEIIKKNGRWKVYELSEITEMYQPKTITSKELIDDGRYKVFGANGVIGYYNEFNHADSEIAITCRGATCGTVNLTEPKSWITGNAMVIKPKNENVNKSFLFHLFTNSNFNSVISGAAQPQITRTNLAKYKIPLPPLEIQEEIVSEIAGFQKIIDGAKQVVENYKPHIDIDPEWKVVELEKVCDVRDGTHDSPKYLNEGIPLITSKNLKNNSIDFTNIKFISENDHDKISQRSKVDKGDVLFAMIGTIGNPTIVNTDRVFSIKNMALFKFQNNILLNNYFLKVILESQYTENNLVTKSRGGTQKFVSLGDLRQFRIPLPSMETQQQIVSKIEEEQKYVDGCKRLVELYEQKIKDRIDKVWEG